MIRGLVVPITPAQRLERMRFLAKRSTLGKLDPFIDIDGEQTHKWPPEYTNGYDSTCPDIYYRLKDPSPAKEDGEGAYNGGKDPTAIDYADRWSIPSSEHVNRTADCMGAMAWCGGFDRYQPERFKHIYGGWINTDSMIRDATGTQRCFRRIARPELGCFVIYKSGAAGHKVGHIGGVIEVPPEWDPSRISCWRRLVVADQAQRSPRPGNGTRDGVLWYHAKGIFVIPIMTP